MIILAVDPQKDRSALAAFVVTPPRLYELFRLVMVGPGLINASNELLSALEGSIEDWQLIVEGQFFHRKHNNPQTLIRLVEARRDWQNAATMIHALGYHPGGLLGVEVVLPSVWQQAMLGGGSRKTLFKRATVVFRDRFGDRWGQTNEHQRDAALIGAWACERWLWEQRTKE